MTQKKPKSKSPLGNRKWSPSKGEQRGRHRRPEKIYDWKEADDRIFDIFRHHDFGQFPHQLRHQLTHFYLLLMENQLRDNFTRLLTLRDVAIKHFIDSLIVARFVDFRFPLLDMGTGPGFPGIPLKILFPDQPIILMEGVEKRIQFLKKVRETLELKDLQIIGRYMTPEFSYPVPAIITRAVADISETIKNTTQCLQPGGFLYLMKGPNVAKEIEQAHQQWSHLFRLKQDFSYQLPSTPHHRRLLVYEKIDADLSHAKEKVDRVFPKDSKR